MLLRISGLKDTELVFIGYVVLIVDLRQACLGPVSELAVNVDQSVRSRSGKLYQIMFPEQNLSRSVIVIIKMVTRRSASGRARMKS